MPDEAAIRAFLSSSNALDATAQRVAAQPALTQQAEAAAGIPRTSIALQGLSPEIGRLTPPSSIPRAEEERSAFIAQNREGDVPLDIDTGASFWNRIKSQFFEDPEQKVKFWQGVSPYVRAAVKNGKPTGGLIMRVMDDQTKQPKDVLIDEQNITAKDWAEFATGALPETVGFIAGIRGGKRLPFVGGTQGVVGGLRDLIAGTIGAETAGGLQDIFTGREDILSKRVEEGAYSLPVGAALGLVGKLVGKVVTPFGYKELPAIQAQGREAKQYFEETMGEKFKYSAGQSTGRPILQRVEAQIERMPGGGGGFGKLGAEQEAIGERIMNRLIGLPADATAAERAAMLSREDVGEAGIAAIRGANQPLEVRAELARRKLVERSQQRIEQDIASATTPQRQLQREKLGALVRNAATQKYDAFDAEAQRLFDYARSLPGGTDRVLVAPNLAKEAADYIAKKLPAPAGGKPLTEFLPPDVINRLETLSKKGGEQFSLQDFVAMRTDVSNAIKTAEATPGVQAHHLGKIRDMLTRAIDESTSAMPTPELKNAWKAANDYYAKNIGQFQTKLGAAMRKTPTDPGYVGPTDLVRRIVSGTDNLLEAKQFLGAGSKEYAALKRGIADDLFQDALYPGSETLNAQAFIKKLSDFRKDNLTAFNETFGSYGNKVIQQAKEMLLGTTPTAKIDAEAALMGIRNPSAVPRLRDMIEAEKAKDVAYQNTIRKAVGSNAMPGDLKASEFVQRFLSSASPKEAKAAMDLLDEGTRRKVQAKMAESILAEAARTPTTTDAVRFRLDPSRIIASDKLIKILGDSERQRVFESVLQPEQLENLKQFAKLIRPVESKQAGYRSAGGIQAGMAIGEFERGGILPFAEKTLVNATLGWILTAPARGYLGNVALQRRGQDAVLSTFLTSTPFIQSLVEDYGKKGAEEAADKIGKMFGVQSQPQQQQQGADDSQSIRQFLNTP